MLFTSMEFLFFFLPFVYGVNYLLNSRSRNYWLLFCSLFFYAWGEPSFVFLMIVSILFNYGVARIINDLDKKKKKKIFLIIDIVFNLGLLFVFKYLNFVTKTVRTWFPATQSFFPETSILLPIGISFFTFQALSYVIDVYRGVPAQKNPAYLGLYISLFPQLIAGPIVRYSAIADQIEHRTVTFASFSDGVFQFLRGFNKKMLLANILAEVADQAFSSNNNSICMAWLGAICYSMQIFFDFSGYSDMAIGLGGMLGFKFEKNFNYPYISRTVTEFWRRWHISLGSWFRDYVYFPLGGSRVKSQRKLIINLLVVWLLTGVWHGAEWTFIIWGLLYGAIIIFEKLMAIPNDMMINGSKVLKILYRCFTCFVIIIGWVLFRALNLQYASLYLSSMFGIAGNAFIDESFLFYIREYKIFLIAGIVCSTPFFTWMKQKVRNSPSTILVSGMEVISSGTQIFLFIIGVSCLIMKTHNPFIYFNF